MFKIQCQRFLTCSILVSTCQQKFPILQGRLRNIMETCLLQLKEYNHSVLEYIGNYCQEAGLKLLHLKNGSIEYHIHPKYVTNGLIYELEKYRRSKNLPRRSIIQWTSRFFPQSALQNPNSDAHYHAWTSLYTQVTRQTHDATKVKSDTDVSQAHLQGYLSQL